MEKFDYKNDMNASAVFTISGTNIYAKRKLTVE